MKAAFPPALIQEAGLAAWTRVEDKALLDGSLRMPKGDCADVVVPLWDAKKLAEKGAITGAPCAGP